MVAWLIQNFFYNCPTAYTRYPDDRFNISRDEVVEAITCAEKILKFVRTKIEESTAPQLNLFEP
jgi:hypothetical protein